MKKIIYNRFNKAWLEGLPKVVYNGKIIVVTSASEAEKAVDYLLSMPILGVDTETRPSFTKNQHYRCSLLQVATHHNCFLFRLNYIGLSRAIVRLLEDTKVPKVGLSLHDDVLSLHKKGDFKPGLFIDLQDHIRELGIEDMSLQKLYANLFGMKISKTQQLSNWEADVLNDKQKAYAATDAWACVMLYEEYLRLKESGDYTLEIVDDSEPEHLDSQS